jgi:hypothetical protein
VKFTGFEQIPVQGPPVHEPLLGCVHTPPLHTSFVHALPSSGQEEVLLGCVHAPPLHTSFVHTLLSVAQGAVLLGCVQTPDVHTSFVHTLLSSVHAVLFAAGVFWHVPALQASVVQGLLSLHCDALEQPPPLRGLSAGPAPVGVKLAFVVKRTLSRTKPSSRIQTLMVWSPGVLTMIVAVGPSMGVRLQVSAVPNELMRSAESGPVPSMPAWHESASAFAPMPRSHTLYVPVVVKFTWKPSSGLVVV